VTREVAYVGLGSNLDDPLRQIGVAVRRLRALADTRVRACSRWYRNPPLGPTDQPDYLNGVVALETGLGARGLLAELHAIERAQGRVRGGRRWGPRTIDLDLLLFGQHVIAEPGLVVPHPELSRRAFVLVPLHEIAPDVAIPGQPGLEVLLAAVDPSAIVPLEAPATID
jgi:2-amino-4-hydroxy-6-hydroxymethyldihydropteridine diphosphokinase